MKITIYLCNYNSTAGGVHGTIDLSGQAQPLLADVQDLISDKSGTSVTIDCVGIYAKPVYEIEEAKYLSGYKYSNSVVYLNIKPTGKYMYYPATEDEITDIYPLLNYKYIWVYVEDYNYQLHASDNCLAVNLVSYEIEMNEEIASKRIVLEFITSYPYEGVE